MYNRKLLIEDSLPPLDPSEFKQLRDSLVIPASCDLDLASFKSNAVGCFSNTTVNKLEGLGVFRNHDIVTGCQQYVDNLISKNGIKGLQIFEHDYHYYKKIDPAIQYVNVRTLSPEKPLLIALPFPGYLGKHRYLDAILDKCNAENIHVHLDCAWMPCAFGIDFDFDQPCIKSFAMSFSKAYALSWSKIGIRWTREKDPTDSISVLNSMNAVPRLHMYVAQQYMDRFPIDYCVKKYKEKYYEICKSLKLRPTNIIHACFSIDRKNLYGLKILMTD